MTRVSFVEIVTDISLMYRYISDFNRFFPISPQTDYRMSISCQDSSIPEMSKIYRDISNTSYTGSLTKYLCSLKNQIFIIIKLYYRSINKHLNYILIYLRY